MNDLTPAGRAAWEADNEAAAEGLEGPAVYNKIAEKVVDAYKAARHDGVTYACFVAVPPTGVWQPTVGESCWWNHDKVTVVALHDGMAWVDDDDTFWTIGVDALTEEPQS